MPSGKSPRQAGLCSIAAFVVACVVLAAPASAVDRRPGDGDLSPRLAELAKPSVRSEGPVRQARELGLPIEGPGSLLRQGNRVLVEVRFDRGASAGVAALRGAGARIVDVSNRYQTVTVAADPTTLSRLSGIAKVASVTEVLAPIVHAAAENPGPVAAAVTPCFGAATSEGDGQLRAAQARAEFEVDGEGVTVGILSDSFDEDALAVTHRAKDVSSGDLPGLGNPCGKAFPVEILDDFVSPEATDEGRAMGQIVHDLAPGASLAFATAFKGITDFAENIEELRDAGATVIVDDVSYFNEPFFQEGPVGVAVSNVAASGVTYFSSAGNNNLISGVRDIASWEAPQFRLADACPPALSVALTYVTECMDFDPEPLESDPTFRATVAKGASLRLDIQWAEPWFGVQTDFDAYLLDKSGDPILDGKGDVVRSEFANVTKTQQPYELLFWENKTGSQQEVQVAINRYTGVGGGGTGTPRFKMAFFQNGSGVTSTEYPESSEGDVVGPTIFGHNGAEAAMSVGAIRYDATESPERFSSRGPTTHYFEPVDGVTPAEPLGSPQVLAKPDLIATDGGANTFFGTCLSDAWRFFGTSAAAPHAAAIAALQRQANPAATGPEVLQAQRDSAKAVGASPPEAVGAGMVDAVGAIEGLGVTAPAPGALPDTPPTPVSCTFVEPKPKDPVPEPPVVPPLPPVAKDDIAPSTFFRQRPAKLIRTRQRKAKAVFRFGSDESGVTFVCRVDGGLFRFCQERLVRNYRIGRHTVTVKAQDGAGNVDGTPATYGFRVKQRAPGP